jgi:hypothetical protein
MTEYDDDDENQVLCLLAVIHILLRSQMVRSPVIMLDSDIFYFESAAAIRQLQEVGLMLMTKLGVT